jgi:dienelactone hydrolase
MPASKTERASLGETAVRIRTRAEPLQRALVLGLSFSLGCGVWAAGPRVLPEGQKPKDIRLEPLKDLDGYFPFTPAKSREACAQRAERVRRQIQVSQGLWPWPERTPLHAVIRDRRDMGDYTIEKAQFESLPGFKVTGSLYRPVGKTGKRPGVLSPHGHWADGRFHDAGLDAVRKEIADGAERFEEGGRSPLQARAVQLARMGCVVFHYDMIGYADSTQISQALAHGFAKQRPEMNASEDWGLFSPQAEAHLQSVMGLQTWSSIRALDFLLSLPDVDSERIGVTGASGGGTQTFILGALDARPAVAFPAVMVSTAMQGGCTCENACLLRVETGNVEFAALFAPKPLGLTSADDWTREMATKGFPELLQHYALLEAPDLVMLKRGEQFGHNFNAVSRAALYSWFNHHLRLSLEEPIVEKDYTRLTRNELSVWDDSHPAPEGGPEFERRLLRAWTEDAGRQLAGVLDDASAFRTVVGGAVEILIGRSLSEVETVNWETVTMTNSGDYRQIAGLLRNRARGEELPAIRLEPRSWNGTTVIWADASGKAGLFEPMNGGDLRLRPAVRQLLERGVEVVGVDLMYQGEFLGAEESMEDTPRVKNPRESAAYTHGYNHSLFAQRVHDLLTTIRYLQGRESPPRQLGMIGAVGAGPWVAAARALSGDAVVRAAVDTRGFRFGKVLDLRDVNFLPGGAKYHDLPGILALNAPGALFLAGEGERAPSVLERVYRAAGAGEQLTCYSGVSEGFGEAAAAWLLRAK